MDKHNNTTTTTNNTLPPELAWALTNLRGQAFKLWVAARALGLTEPSQVTGKVMAQFDLSSDVCAKYRDAIFEGPHVSTKATNAIVPTSIITWENYYPLYLEALKALGLEETFWKIGEIAKGFPTLYPKTLVRCAMKYASEVDWDDGIEDLEFLEMVLATELSKLNDDNA